MLDALLVAAAKGNIAWCTGIISCGREGFTGAIISNFSAQA